MNKMWSDRAWDDYLYWQSVDRRTAKKINDLIKDIERNGLSKGIGKRIVRQIARLARNAAIRVC